MLEVHQLYNDTLHRNADPGGISEYKRMCLTSRQYVENILRTSGEYRSRNATFYTHNGITLCCAIKNRWDMLVQSLPTWLACMDVSEILIVDYGSDISVYESLKDLKMLDERIRVIQVLGVNQWCLSKAYNIAMYHAKYNIIVKMDTDYKLTNPEFFKNHILKEGVFFAGNWRNSRDENEDHLNGFVYIYKHDFFRINGYSENITTYGRDDEDLYERLRLIDMKRTDISNDYIHHIPHGDHLRTKHQQMNTQNCHDEIIFNEGVKRWTNNDFRETFHVVEAYDGLWYASDTPFFIFRPHHGLGNRLRSLMSVLQFVKKYDMTLVLQWPVDHHLHCKFSSLFTKEYPMMSPDIKIPFHLGGDKYNYVDDEAGNNKGESVKYLNRPIFAKSNCVLEFEGHDYNVMAELLRELPICKDVLEIVPKIDRYTVGVHIRMDNKMSNAWEIQSNYNERNFDVTQRERTKSHYSNFVSEMLKLEETLDCDWFICTDTPRIIPRMKQIFGERVIYNDVADDIDSVANDNVVDREEHSIKLAFADMLTLSKCDAVLGSSWSSFTEAAKYLKYGNFDFFRIVGTDF